MQATGEKVSLEELKWQAIESYAVFARLMQDDGYFDPVHEYLCNWTQKHIERMEEEIERKGYCNGRLLFVMPRGSLKSTIVTKHLTVWLTVRRFYKFNDDTTRSLIAGNTYTNSKKKLNGIRGVFDAVDLFKALFPEILPRRGGDNKSKWTDEAASINHRHSLDEETFEVGSLNTALTGRHYNIILEDDTTAPDADEMKQDLTRPSTETIEKAIGFHQAAVPLWVPKGFRLSVVVTTRWAMYDLASFVQENEDYFYFDVPAMRPDGSPMFTSFYDEETLELTKKRVGEYMFSMLFLNKPLDDSLRVFKSTDMQWISKKKVPENGIITIAIDPAISEKDDACETSITVNHHYIDDEGRKFEYWLEDVNGHMLPMPLAEKILALADKYHSESTPVRALIVEDVAYQAALKYILIDLMNKRESIGKRRYPIVPFRSRQNKEVRIEGMQPSFQQKRIYFVKGSLSDQTESQLLQFPMGRLVDTIDSWSMHRKVWRSERYEMPKAPSKEYTEDFETIYEEQTRRRWLEERGSLSGFLADEVIGEGLSPSGKIYY